MAAILLTPGQSVGQGDWEAVFAQHGGFKSVQMRPPTQQEVQAAAQGGDPDPAYQQAPIYRYHLNDGSYVEARTAQNGVDYAVIAYQPSARFTQEQTKETRADTPEAKNEAELQRQREKNAALPPGQDPFYETDAERAKRAQDTITRQGKEAQDAQTRSQAQQPQSARAPVDNHPGVYLVTTKNPQTGQTESHYENESGQKIPQPADIKPGTIVKGGGVNGEDVQAIADPTTGTIKYEPIPGAQVPAANRPIPSGAPVYRPDYNQDDLGLGSYNEQLLAAQRAGIITAEQGRQLVTQASALAQTSAGHGSTLRGQESTTRGQDITQRQQDINETDSRRTFQGSGFDNTLRELGSNARYLGAGHGGLAADAFLEALNLRQRYAAGAGGFEEHPQVAAARAGTQVHIGPDGNVAISPPGAVPGAASALGPVAAGVTATNQAAMNPTGPNVQAATDATMAGSNAAFGALGIDPPGVRTGANMTGTGVDAPVVRGPQPPAFSAPPLEGSGISRGPADGGASSDPGFTRDLPPIPGMPPAVPMPDHFPRQGELPSYLQPVATPQWQPHGVTAQLRDQGYSDEEIQQAMQMAGVG